MSALMDLLETILGYVADDQILFQRLKHDLKQDSEENDSEELNVDSEENGDDTLPDVNNDDEDLISDKLRELK